MPERSCSFGSMIYWKRDEKILPPCSLQNCHQWRVKRLMIQRHWDWTFRNLSRFMLLQLKRKMFHPSLEWPENYPTGKNLSIRLSYLLDWTKQSKRMDITFFQKLTRKEHLAWVLVLTFSSLLDPILTSSKRSSQ